MSITDFLTEYRNIQVSSEEAEKLATFWRDLREMRPKGSDMPEPTQDIPLVYNPVVPYYHE